MTYNESIILTGEEWNNLTENKKLEVLQSIENHMAFESGRLSCPVEGKFLHTGGDGIVLGTYDPVSRRIYVNSSQFDSDSMYGKNSEALVTTCLHEGRHAYQHQVVDGIISHEDPGEIETWRENLKKGNYISYKENPRGYYEQPVEVDARNFATVRYEKFISERSKMEMDRHADYKQSRQVFETQMSKQSQNEGLVANYNRLDLQVNSKSESLENENHGIHA